MSELVEKKHAPLGVASCVIGIFNLSYAVFLVYEFYFNDGKSFPKEWFGQVSGLFFIPLLFLVIPILGNGIGLFLGLVSVFQRNHQRLFAVLGLAINVFVVIFLFSCLLFTFLNR